MHDTCSSSATYASIASGDGMPRRRRASELSATAGVVTARIRMPASRSGCSASAKSVAEAIDTTTGRRAARPSDAEATAISAQTPDVSSPAAASDAIASARISSYDPAVTIT